MRGHNKLLRIRDSFWDRHRGHVHGVVVDRKTRTITAYTEKKNWNPPRHFKGFRISVVREKNPTRGSSELGGGG
jgi:hypothetical protein